MEFHIFVDASTVPKNPGSVGVAFSAVVDGKRIVSWASGGQGTSNYGEILAMAFSLEVLKPASADDVLIVTDSLYALNVVTGKWPAGVNAQVASAVGVLAVGLRGLQFDLVAGHEGVPGNEMADFASHQSGIQGVKDPFVPIYIPPAIGMHNLRVLESHLMPRIRELGGSLRDRLFRLHRLVCSGRRELTGMDEDVIREARMALGMEGAIP